MMNLHVRYFIIPINYKSPNIHSAFFGNFAVVRFQLILKLIDLILLSSISLVTFYILGFILINYYSILPSSYCIDTSVHHIFKVRCIIFKMKPIFQAIFIVIVFFNAKYSGAVDIQVMDFNFFTRNNTLLLLFFGYYLTEFVR